MDYDQSDIPAVYDAGRAYEPRVLKLWLDTVSQHVPNPVSRVLDIGCGTGRYSAPLAEYFGADVEAIDPSHKMLEQARSKPHARVRFRKAAAEEIPIHGESVDLIFMSMVFHHFESPALVAQECSRVLRRDGVVCLRAGTIEQIPTYPYVRFFERSASILKDHIQSRGFIESTFAQASLDLVHHELVDSEVAIDWGEYANRLDTRADSVLVQLTDDEFQAGINAVRKYAESHSGAGPVTELIDFFVFCHDTSR